MIPVAFFNNKGGVGKTSLVYHVAWALTEIGERVLMLDLDPQANLSALCLDEERLEELWGDEPQQRRSVYASVVPVQEELGDISPPHVEYLSDRLGLVPGDPMLSGFEAKLSEAWPMTVDGRAAAFRATSAFYRVARLAAARWSADLVLIDVGPNLGALNRSALISADFLVVPLGADLFSIQALRNLGPALRRWRSQWSDRVARCPVPELELPSGRMEPVGYVVMQPNMYGGKVTRAYDKWFRRIPKEFAEHIAQVPSARRSVAADPASFGVVRHYRSLMALAHEARKPIFHLQAADGALGAHATAAQEAGKDFRRIARALVKRVDSSRA